MLIDLVLTVPGAHVGFGAQTGSTNPLYWRPGQRSAVVIGGSRANANFFLLDGRHNTDPTFNTQNLSPSPDCGQGISSGNEQLYGRYGRRRRRPDQYHQRIPAPASTTERFYEFLRNGAMDASTFASMGNNHLVQKQFWRLLRRHRSLERRLFSSSIMRACASRRQTPRF